MIDPETPVVQGYYLAGQNIIDHVRIKRAVNSELYVLLIASNNKVVFQTETYANGQHAFNVAERIASQLGGLTIKHDVYHTPEPPKGGIL